MNKLNYLWRIFATGLCFATFSISGLVLSYVVIPCASVVHRDPAGKRRHTRKLIHKCFFGFTRMMSLLGVAEFDLQKAEQELARHRGRVVIANHPSLIDVVALIAVMPHADCIVKQALWRNPFIKGVLQAAGYIKNTSNFDELIAACRESLNEGYSLIIFPEGTRTTPDKEMILHRGASHIALRCQVDMVPVLIRCTPTTLTKNEKWYAIPSRKFKFSLQVQEPISIASFTAEDKSLAVKARHLTARIKNHYSETLKCYV